MCVQNDTCNVVKVQYKTKEWALYQHTTQLQYLRMQQFNLLVPLIHLVALLQNVLYSIALKVIMFSGKTEFSVIHMPSHYES